MKRISQLEAPALAGVVKERTAAAAVAEIANCRYDGADMIDLHLSCLEERDESTLRAVIGASRLPVLALNYDQAYDRTACGFTEEEREALFLTAVRAGAAGVDMQGYTFDAKSKAAFCGDDRYPFTKKHPKEVVTDPAVIARQCAFIETVHSMGAEVLLSCHTGVAMDAGELVALALFLEERGPDVIKLVTPARDEAELAESLRAMTLLKREVKTPVSYHANGAAGRLSRIVNPVMGGQILFCCDRYHAGSLTEQPDLRTARAVVDGLKKML